MQRVGGAKTGDTSQVRYPLHLDSTISESHSTIKARNRLLSLSQAAHTPAGTVEVRSRRLNSTHVQIHGLPVTVALFRVCSVLGRDNRPWQPGRFDQELLLAGLLEEAEEVDTFVYGSTHYSQLSAKDMRNDNSHVKRP
jgi:hypothetical protein